MKKLKLTMASLAFVLFLSSTAFAFQTNEPRPQNNSQSITYVVSVLPSTSFSPCNKYFVNVTDNQGNLVDAPQEYIEGKSNYIFHELGPIMGTRIANMEIMGGPINICNLKTYIKSDEIFGRFNTTHTYEFFLEPRTIPGDD